MDEFSALMAGLGAVGAGLVVYGFLRDPALYRRGYLWVRERGAVGRGSISGLGRGDILFPAEAGAEEHLWVNGAWLEHVWDPGAVYVVMGRDRAVRGVRSVEAGELVFESRMYRRGERLGLPEQGWQHNERSPALRLVGEASARVAPEEGCAL